MGDDGPEEIRQRFRRAFQVQNAAGRTTESIAKELKLPASTVRNYANGSRMPPAALWAALARALDVSENYFMHGETDDDELHRVELVERVAALSLQAAVLGEWFEPFLNGEPIPRDPAALVALGRAIGRQPREDRPAASG